MRTTLLIGLLLLAGCGDDNKTPAQGGIEGAPIGNAAPAPDVTPAEMAEPAETPPALPANQATAEPADPSKIPAAIRGQWVGLSERCGDRGAPLALEVTQSELLFHESVGTIKKVEAASGDARRVTADFTGEGESWTRTLLLQPSASGHRLTITQQGSAVTRKRCDG